MPHEGFVDHMKAFLQILRKGDSVDAEEEARVRRMKNYYLNKHVFPAMANLTFFFQATSLYPELRKEFQLQIYDLLGIRRLNPSSARNPYGFMFQALLDSILHMNQEPDDYRVRLLHIITDLVFYSVQNVRNIIPSTGLMLHEDIGRAMAWTELLASRVKDVYDFDILIHGLEDHEKYPNGGTKRTTYSCF